MKEQARIPLIAPSILSADFAHLEDQVKMVEEAGVDVLHVDVMDGHFVPNITIGPLVVKALKGITSLPLDVHLMISEPDRYILPFHEAGADWLTIHIEVMGHHQMMIQKIKDLGMKAGVAINPATSLKQLEWIIDDLDLMLIMSVNPGFGGQSFIPFCMAKIKEARRMIDSSSSNVMLAVDGGVKLKNCLEIARAGGELLVMGSAIFNAHDPALEVKETRDRLKLLFAAEV